MSSLEQLCAYDLGKLPEEFVVLFKELIQKTNEANKRAEAAEARANILAEQVRLLLIKKYGGKSDKLSDGQLTLFEVEPGVFEVEVEKEANRPEEQKRVITKRREHFGRNPLPAHLPRREEIIKVEAEKCWCPYCNEKRVVIGYEEKEVLDMEPVKYFVRVYKREKLACRKCPEGGVETAVSRGPQIIEKGKLSDKMIVDIIVKKYHEHLPLYRQEAILEQDFGIEVARATMCRAVMEVGSLIVPVREAMRKDLLSGEYIQADETPIGVQAKVKRGSNHQAYEFQYSRPGGPVVFDFQMGRSREGPKNFLENYEGILQTDGYEGYEKIGGTGIERAGCFAHVRRKFVDVHKLDPNNTDAVNVVDLIAQIYAVDAKARKDKLDAQGRKELRQEQSVSIFKELKRVLLEIKSRVLPSSGMGKACNYAFGEWSKLETIFKHGIIELDNNWCENAMRPLALGRKNWLHIGSKEAGPKIAAILSVLATCKRIEINARDYLNDVLPKLGDWPISKVAELTPSAWKIAR